MSVAHGADHGEAVSGKRQVQVGEKDIERLRRDMPERVTHVGGSYNLKPVALQSLLQHQTD